MPQPSGIRRIVADRAAEYIDTHGRDKPFYLQVNFTAPHWPWEGPGDQATSDTVTAAMAENPLTALFHFEGGSLDTYRRMVEALDAGVGTILDALSRSGLGDDTIVVFSSDNGGERFAFLWPFVGEKGDLEEGGIRVPMIVRWPRALPAGVVSDHPVITMDLTATLVDAAGTEPDPDTPLDGVSLLPWWLDGAGAPQRDLRWRTRDQGALRRGPYKLLFDRQAKPLWGRDFAADGPRVRLFDVTADGREKADISKEQPVLTAQLLAQWHAFDTQLLPYPPLSALAPARGRAD